ncbi:MAG: hypothetical protein M3Y84_06230, partial [Acidobacteriota bacterium]|nr:hypothetical protein [Acidobacteriota bacterium]
VSSTDPWHRARDLDPGTEQPSFERVASSGLTRGQPLLAAVPIAYGTPADAAAELRYLRARGIPFTRAELGEEPDGQLLGPEDYGALYDQFARVLTRAAPGVTLGGPSLATSVPDWTVAPDASGNRSWTSRFLGELHRRGASRELGFFSFEWYPFDDVCQPTAPQLAQASQLLKDSLAKMQDGGLTRAIPWIITEYGYSAFGGRAEMDIEGALLNADVAATFLTLGGEQTFLYGYEPNEIIHEVACSSGNNMLFLLRDDGTISYRMPTYYGARLLTQEWAQPGDGLHELYIATVDEAAMQNRTLITAYPLLRPDHLWSVMLVNKDSSNAHPVEVRFYNQGSGSESEFEGAIDLYQYSRKQYELSVDKQEPYPTRDQPPEHRTIPGSNGLVVQLPAYSITVIRGTGPAPSN